MGQLPAGLAEQLGAQGADEPGVLGDRDELRRTHAGGGRVDPAGERLEAEEAAVGELDDGLVGEAELAPLEAAAQAQLEGAALLDLRAHLDVEDLDTGLGLDGTGHGDAGVGDELVDRAGLAVDVAVGDGDADRGADEGLVVVDDEGALHGLDDPGGEVGGGGGVGDPFDHDDEAVLGEAAHERVGADGGDDAAGGLTHQAVAGGVTEGVGDHGDALEADEQHGHGGAVERGPAQGGVEVGGEQHPVRELGELVVGGAVLELALGVGVVGDGADEPEDLAVLTGHGGQAAAHRADADGGDDAAVDDAGLGLGEHPPGDGGRRGRGRRGGGRLVMGRPASVGSWPMSSWRSRFR